MKRIRSAVRQRAPARAARNSAGTRWRRAMLNRMLLLLRRVRQEAALRQLLDDQQSRPSPTIQPGDTEQFGKQFGPSTLTFKGDAW